MADETMFDGLSRVMASPISRGRALKYLAFAVAGTLLAPKLVKAGGQACPLNDSGGRTACPACGGDQPRTDNQAGTPCVQANGAAGVCRRVGGGCCQCRPV